MPCATTAAEHPTSFERGFVKIKISFGVDNGYTLDQSDTAGVFAKINAQSKGCEKFLNTFG